MQNGIIKITDDMSRAENVRARKHNRELAYVEMDQYYKDHHVPELTVEQEKLAKEYLREMLKEAGFDLD